MPQLARNQKTVTAARLRDGKRTEYTILGVKGLRLHVYPGGARRWYVGYKIKHGRARHNRSFLIGDAGVIGLGQAIR